MELQKKRTFQKPDRRMSPLNPQSAVISRDSESPPISPQSTISPFSDDIKKRSIGLSLRRLATEKIVQEKPLEPSFKGTEVIKEDTAPKRLHSKELQQPAQNSTAAALIENRYVDQPRSHLIFRSASFQELPKWTKPDDKDNGKSNCQSFYENLINALATPASLWTFCDNSPNKTNDTRAGRLRFLMNSFSAWDVYAYTSFVENSRRAKNYLWRSKPIGIWPDWHEGLYSPCTNSPLPTFAEMSIDSTWGYTANAVRSKSRSNASPILHHMPSKDTNTLVSAYSHDDEDSDASRTSSKASNRSKLNTKRVRNQLSVSTRMGVSPRLASVPGSFDEIPESKVPLRSYSDGDLTEYLKGFSDLKASLQMAQMTCNNEVKKILEELQLNSQKGLDSLLKRHNTNSGPSTSLRIEIITPNRTEAELLRRKQNQEGGNQIEEPKITGDSPVDAHFHEVFLNLISVAQNILDLSLTAIMAPNVVSSYIFQLQDLLNIWQKNPSWPFQELVIRLLIVFSSVARILEFFEEDVRTWVHSTTGEPQRGRTVRKKVKNKTSQNSLRTNYDPFDSEDYESDYSSPPRKSISAFKGWPGIALENSYSKYHQPVVDDQNLNVIIELNKNGVPTYVSSTSTKVFQYEPGKIVGQAELPFLIDKSKNVFQEAVKAASDDSIQIKFTAKRVDGRTIKMEGRGLVKRGVEMEVKSSIWIIRPVKVSRGIDSPQLLPASLQTTEPELELIPNVDLALCSICERSVPAIMFKVHTEACLKIHKTEMDLVLLNDEVRTQITKCENNNSIITGEIQTLKQEGDDNDDKKTYLQFLEKLESHSREILDTLCRVKAFHVPSVDSNLFEMPMVPLLSWDCPPQREFLFNQELNGEVDNGIVELGLDLYAIGKSCQEYTKQKQILISKMRIESNDFQECLQSEQILLMEIQAQTASQQLAQPDIPAGLKFETQEIGGVMVRIPSLGHVKTNSAGQKESLFFSNVPRSASVASSDSSAASNEQLNAPAEPLPLKKGLKRHGKRIGLRVKTTEETESDTSRRSTSARNPRMVVGDKALEIEVGSPLLSARAYSISQNNVSLLSASPASPIIQVPSIRDYEIIKPISKGAFGSVYLTRKKISGEYYAIKVLKKSDMVAKNQALNIKSERTILTQIDSPYIVKLYSTFQSKDRIFLVMEFLNGGDCASLLKSVGQLDENWARQYATEMIQGLEFLHHRDIVHRDLKPDNMLIDSAGHIKLTDFGLSKAGFLGRRAIGVGDAAVGQSFSSLPSQSNDTSSLFPPHVTNYNRRLSTVSVSSTESSTRGRIAEKLEASKQKGLVGTPDYLAPESILGLPQGFSVDWWAVGVIMYEFLYGIPPFNAPTPPEVFENILMRRIDWLECEISLSPEARDLMEKLMCTVVESRLGSKGSIEVKQASWFVGVDWDNLIHQKVYFIPAVKNIEDTDYFDSRGMQPDTEHIFEFEDKPQTIDQVYISSQNSLPQSGGQYSDQTDFGEVVYKNISLLEKQNQMTASRITMEHPDGDDWLQRRRDSLPFSALSLTRSPLTPHKSVLHNAISAGSRRESLPNARPISNTPSSAMSEFSLNAGRRNSDIQSSSESTIPSLSPNKMKSQAYLDVAKRNLFDSIPRESLLEHEHFGLDFLIAETNPICSKILETILKNRNGRCVIVGNGAEAIQHLMGAIKFACAFIGCNLEVAETEEVIKMVKSTPGNNSNTPLILLKPTSGVEKNYSVDHVITLPLTKENVIIALEKVGIDDS